MAIGHLDIAIIPNKLPLIYFVDIPAYISLYIIIIFYIRTNLCKESIPMNEVRPIV